ncbi:MAG: hypothetical protein V7K32_20070 [Nostoc sp.]
MNLTKDFSLNPSVLLFSFWLEMRVKQEFQSALDDFRYEPQNLF